MALSRFRRRDPSADVDGGAPADGPPPPRRPVATPGMLRRERRALVRAREERIRDLGGLMLEMYRRDHFREDLIFDQCAELVGLEARLADLDQLLATTSARGGASRCECGAPTIWGSHFCANCGRPVGEAVVACARCGNALPAEARFCLTCGTPASPPAPAGEEPKPEPAPAAAPQNGNDPWES